MFNCPYKKALLTGIGFWLFALAATAQSNFLYIQSENSQPYYLQLAGNNYSSNAKGYLLIPQMKNGGYSIIVGFAGNQFPEYTFSFTIENKPRGYSLKFTPEGEWVLMDMVSMEPIRGIASEYVPNKSAGKQVQKLSEKVLERGIDQVYAVKNGSVTDTVELFIPATPFNAVHKKITKQ